MYEPNAWHKPKLASTRLVHLPDELVNVLLPVALVTALNVVLKLALAPATRRVGQLEWPQEVGCL